MPQIKQNGISATLHKHERLNSKKEIDFVFEKGRALYHYPLKLMYASVPNETGTETAALFVAPKRSFKRANDRNLLKRRMREAYRLSKSDFVSVHSTSSKRVTLCFIYTSKTKEAYSKIEQAILTLLKKVNVE